MLPNVLPMIGISSSNYETMKSLERIENALRVAPIELLPMSLAPSLDLRI